MPALKAANMEPIPGYRLLEPLGKGGFGEVWKCEAPGGLHKAIKFVSGGNKALVKDAGAAGRELHSLQHIKTIRHPFLLSMDRVELVEGELVIVMELADRTLHDQLHKCRQQGLAGIPRQELLGYLHEAAEVLDLMNQQYGLQHLDIKPKNLFLVSRHVKVADFGLVNSLVELYGSQLHTVQLRALTPLYAAPESFRGGISPFSDQYSLAITYFELLLGAPPFTGKNLCQLALHHLQTAPNLDALPEPDRAPLARALAKDPQHRFPSCLALVEALGGSKPASRPAIPGPGAGAPGSCGPAELPPAVSQPKTPTEIDIGTCEMSSTAIIDLAEHTGLHHLAITGVSPKPIIPEPLPGPTKVIPVLANSAAPPARNASHGTGREVQALPGYQLLECRTRAATGELWKARNVDGQPCLVRLVSAALPETPRAREELIARLRQLQEHPILDEAEVLFTSAGQLALISWVADQTFVEHLRQYQRQGHPGIPRDELLDYLGVLADALDSLVQGHGMQHLALGPRRLLLYNRQLYLADFGLAHLVWLPAGLPPGKLQARYAAPELLSGAISPACDQFSLALIYLELLTGQHPFRNLNPRQLASARLRGQPDLSLAPGPDRPLLRRALHADPDQRFRSCSELIAALRQTGLGPNASLQGQAGDGGSGIRVVAGLRVPALKRLVRDLVLEASGDLEIVAAGAQRYMIKYGPYMEHHAFARMLPATVKLKLNGFRKQWRAKVLGIKDDRYIFQVRFPGHFLERLFGWAPGLEIHVSFDWAHSANGFTQVNMELHPLACTADKALELLQDVGPRLLNSLRNYLQTSPERRSQERFPYTRNVSVTATMDSDGTEEVLTAQGRDISPGGMGLYLPRKPASVWLNLHLHPPGRPDLVSAVPARIVNAQVELDGRYRVGVSFIFEERLPEPS